ncbi:MAG: hypothetical protein J6A96_00930 [Clostridia bacterium]|nr:hypothetical protein [Clostridia bacterium]
MDHKALLFVIFLAIIIITFVVATIIYAIMAVGARSEPKPKEEYYLIITKSKHRRVRKDENTKQ